MKRVLAVLVVFAATLSAQQRSLYQQTQYKGQEIGKLTGDVYYARMDDYVSVFMVTPEGIILAEPIGTEMAAWLKPELSRRFNVPVHIVVPRGNSTEKNAAMRAQGAELIEFGDDFQESREHALQLAQQHGWHFVPNYHRDIVKGVATYWLEFFEAVPNVDVVYVPIGQGSGICSCVAVRNGLNLRTRIIGVVPEGAPAYALSFQAKKAIAAPVTTLLGDGMACRVPDDASLEVILENVERVVVVSEQEMAQAMKMYFTDTHNVVEGAGAAGLAAAFRERSTLQGKRVGLVATGGNVDHDVFAKVLSDG